MISRYIIGVLLALTILFGGLAYNQYSEVQTLTTEVKTYKDAAEDNLKAKEDADASCKATVESLEIHYKEQVEFERAKKRTEAKIDKLPNLTIKEKKDAAPTQSQNYSDDDHLSPDIMLLLDEAYCYGNPNDCSITTK